MEKLILFVLIGLVLVWACYKMYFKVRFEYLLREMSRKRKSWNFTSDVHP
jgi:hypothetical protein